MVSTSVTEMEKGNRGHSDGVHICYRDGERKQRSQ